MRLNDGLIAEPAYRDVSVADGVHYAYMVGAVHAGGSEELDGPVEIVVEFRVGDMALSAPLPNPSRGEVQLRYRASGAGDGSIVIYSPDGRLVRRLADGLRGEGTVTWNGRSDGARRVAPGVYFVRLTAGTESAHRKVVLIE